MKYQQWESPADLENEQGVASCIEQAFQCQLHKLPKSYRLDFMATREGDGVAWIEVKCRKHASTKYPTVMLSLSKVLAGLELESATDLKAYFVVRFTDCTKYAPFTEAHSCKWGGRTKNTRDSRDIEPVLHFTTPRMETLKP